MLFLVASCTSTVTPPTLEPAEPARPALSEPQRPAPSGPAVPPRQAPSGPQRPAPVVDPAPELPGAWSVDACRGGALREALRSGADPGPLTRDVDGDGVLDVLQHEHDAASGGSGSRIVLTLSATHEQIALDTSFSYASMRNVNPIPPALLRRGRQAARGFVEDVELAPICPTPDPSLALLLDPDRAPSWHPGPLVLPPWYTIVRDGQWISYAGQAHAGLTGRRDFPERLEVRDGVELLRTAHGVAVQARDRSRHAWLWVSPGGNKLRWPRPIEAALTQAGAVEIRYQHDVLDDASGWTTLVVALPP